MRLYLIVIMDKELAGEPDIGMAIIEGNAKAASRVAGEMEQACILAGRGRCIGRWREIERGKHYRAAALLRTAPR